MSDPLVCVRCRDLTGEIEPYFWTFCETDFPYMTCYKPSFMPLSYAVEFINWWWSAVEPLGDRIIEIIMEDGTIIPSYLLKSK